MLPFNDISVTLDIGDINVPEFTIRHEWAVDFTEPSGIRILGFLLRFLVLAINLPSPLTVERAPNFYWFSLR